MTEEKNTSQSTVLVIDDTAENLAMLSAVMEGQYKVKVANSGARGLAIAQGDHPPDLILLDVMMPGMDGIETCLRLKGHEVSKSIPIIFLSGKTDADDEEKGLDAGAADYIHKPLNPAVVLRRIDTQLRLAAAERAAKKATIDAVTTRRDLSEQARALEAFESIVTHDARSSLSVINGYASLLRKKAEAAGDTQATQFLTSIRDGAKSVSTLVTQWREIARTLRKPMHPAPLDMAAVVKAALTEALGAHGPEDSDRKPCVTIDELPSAWADEAAVRLVWVELITNAIRYAKPGAAAVFRIHARRGAAEHVYCIDDEGIGFDAEDEARLFTPYQRLHAETLPDGAGLGLFLARQAVCRNGGQIWAEAEAGSSSENGARFRFSLPCSPPSDGLG